MNINIVPEQNHPEAKTFLVCDLTPEDRKKYIDSIEDEFLKSIFLQNEKDGCYDRCPDIDYCKLVREEEEKKKKDKEDLINLQSKKINELESIVIQQNQLLAQIIEKIKNI